MKFFKYIGRFVIGSIRMLKEPKFQVATFLIALSIATGAVFYSQVEQLNLIDSFYLTVMTLTTIGYGDVVPLTDVGKIFTIFYSIVGVGIMFAFIAALAKYIQKDGALIKEVRHRRKKRRNNKEVKK